MFLSLFSRDSTPPTAIRIHTRLSTLARGTEPIQYSSESQSRSRPLEVHVRLRMTDLLDFAIITIFAREVLEGGIIIGEYRTVILRSDWRNPDFTQQDALRAVTLSAILSAAFAVVVIIAILIPLFILSREFNQKTAILIEGASKIVAAICILQLSLKMPKFFGLYYSKSQVEKLKKGELVEENQIVGLSLRSIRFNVAWNIWREVAECGVFLIPSFLSGEIKNIPLSAVTGCVVGGAICFGIYYANHRVKNTMGLTIFTVGLLVLLSTVKIVKPIVFLTRWFA